VLIPAGSLFLILNHFFKRLWGVPIPAITCLKCGTCSFPGNFIRSVAERVKANGIEFWAGMENIEDLKKENILNQDFRCLQCQNDTNFQLERDTLDVWFVSGISHTIISDAIDICVEGRDQHSKFDFQSFLELAGGWFSSSLLTSLMLKSKSPFNTLVTHGFVLNSQLQKYSKSQVTF
jgi:isoleucyl-tRNA synthetase